MNWGALNQVIFVDTAKVDAKGNFTFEGKQHLAEGLYFVEFPTKKRLDLVIGHTQNFEFSSYLLHLSNNISFKNSEENTLYYNYINFVRSRQSTLKTRLTPEQSSKIQQELYNFQTNFFKTKNGYLSVSILAASEVPYIPSFTLPNEPQLWDASALKQMTARANILRPLLLGKKIPNMTVTGTDGKMYSLHDIQARYTILYIYSLNCPPTLPRTRHQSSDSTKKLESKGVKFFVVAVERDEVKWKSFITKYRTQNLLNLIDKSGNINFIKDFNTIEYPTDFVLDAQKKIVGKQINPSLLEDFIKYLD